MLAQVGTEAVHWPARPWKEVPKVAEDPTTDRPAGKVAMPGCSCIEVVWETVEMARREGDKGVTQGYRHVGEAPEPAEICWRDAGSRSSDRNAGVMTANRPGLYRKRVMSASKRSQRHLQRA